MPTRYISVMLDKAGHDLLLFKRNLRLSKHVIDSAMSMLVVSRRLFYFERDEKFTAFSAATPYYIISLKTLMIFTLLSSFLAFLEIHDYVIAVASIRRICLSDTFVGACAPGLFVSVTGNHPTDSSTWARRLDTRSRNTATVNTAEVGWLAGFISLCLSCFR